MPSSSSPGNSHLSLLETLYRVDNIIVGAADLDTVLTELLDLTLILFGADRAWLLNPCDPQGSYWRVPYERTAPGWPGAFATGARTAMTADMAASFRELLDSRRPVQYGPGGDQPVPPSIALEFKVKSRLATAIRPRVGAPWLFGIHYCEHTHQSSEHDIEHFAALGERIGDALSTLLLMQRLDRGKQRYRHLFEQAPISLWEEDASSVKRYLDQLHASGVDDLQSYFEQHPDAVAECAKRMRVLDVNRATLELYHARDKQQLLGELDKTFTEQSLKVFQQELVTLAGGANQFSAEAQTRTLTGEGRDIMLRVALAPGHQQDWARLLVAISDISAHKAAENEVHRLNRTLRLIGECNRALIGAQSETELLDAVCSEIIVIGGYRLAWVGFIDHNDPDKRILCVASAGVDDGYLAQLRVSWGDGPDGATPCGTAIRERRVVVCADIQDAASAPPWRDAAIQRGYRGSVALPLIYREQLFGTLNIYADQANAFSEQELALLGEFAEDIAYGIQVQRERQQQEHTRRHLQALYDASPDMIFVHAADGALLDVNDNTVKGFGYPSKASLLTTALNKLHGRNHSNDAATAHIQKAQIEGNNEFEWRARRYDGSEFDVEIRLRALDEKGRVLAVVRDISERKSLQARLAQQAYYDELTGLANRRLAMERITLTLSMAARDGSQAALMLLDLDNFKHINDTYGHAAGDQLLIAVAERLNGSARESDTVARLGGDEFVVLMTEVRDDAEILNLADKILRVFDRAVVVDGRKQVATTSIGIARFPSDGDDCDTLMRAADSAMYKAKHAGRNTYCFFSKDTNRRMDRFLDVGTALHHALKQDELKVHYQPIVRPDGLPVGVEALLRWHHRRWGPVSPCEFIPIAEDRGLIIAIGREVLQQACQQLARWRDDGLPLQWVSVNLSPRQFWEPDLSDYIASVLTSTGLDGACLKLEITEGLLLDHPPQALSTLERLRDMSIHLALDDFGTGYSSLSYLKRYPFDTLKIDRSFIHNLEHDQDDLSLTRTIIAMARVLGLETIAEGVETERCAGLLIEEGCNLLQGFLYSAAMPVDEVETWTMSKMTVATDIDTAN